MLVVYGYRRPPDGIRARRLDAECSVLGTESILRQDGGDPHLGYPWACTVSEDRLLVVYYFRVAGGTRHIANTFLELGKE